jgi:hypothetical protein
MQQRSEPKRSLDDFPTPPWATRALCEALQQHGHDLLAATVREPAANRGFMVRPLQEYFADVKASDIADYGYGWAIEDFLFPYQIEQVGWTITNPPFTLADRFVERALETSRIGCAIIVRSAFLEGIGRYEQLFRDNSPALVLQFCERVAMVRNLSARKKRGRFRSLSNWLDRSEDDVATAGLAVDHPRPDRRRLHEDSLLGSEAPDRVTSNAQRLQAVLGHVAGSQRGLMVEVFVTLRPILQKVDGVFDAVYLSNQISSLFQVDGSVEHLRDHFYLTENVGDQQGRRCGSAPVIDLWCLVFRFKRGQVQVQSWEVAI